MLRGRARRRRARQHLPDGHVDPGQRAGVHPARRGDLRRVRADVSVDAARRDRLLDAASSSACRSWCGERTSTPWRGSALLLVRPGHARRWRRRSSAARIAPAHGAHRPDGAARAADAADRAPVPPLASPRGARRWSWRARWRSGSRWRCRCARSSPAPSSAGHLTGYQIGLSLRRRSIDPQSGVRNNVLAPLYAQPRAA